MNTQYNKIFNNDDFELETEAEIDAQIPDAELDVEKIEDVSDHTETDNENVEIETDIDVDIETPTGDPTKIGKVSCKKLYLRPLPSSDADDFIKILEENDEVLIYEEVGDWYEVCTASGVEGFVMADFIKIVDE